MHINVDLKKRHSSKCLGISVVYICNGGGAIGNTLQNWWFVNNTKIPRFLPLSMGSAVFLPRVIYVDICVNYLVFVCFLVALGATSHIVFSHVSYHTFREVTRLH